MADYIYKMKVPITGVIGEVWITFFSEVDYLFLWTLYGIVWFQSEKNIYSGISL